MKIKISNVPNSSPGHVDLVDRLEALLDAAHMNALAEGGHMLIEVDGRPGVKLVPKFTRHGPHHWSFEAEIA